MSILHNISPRKQLKKQMLSDSTKRLNLCFYKYFEIKNPQEYRNTIYEHFYRNNILGRVYIANEGINAQISIPKTNYLILKKFLYHFDPCLNNLYINQSLNNEKSFWMLTVKVKEKIISDGIKEPFFDPNHVGVRIKSKAVNSMLNDKNTIFVDMRNSYEYEIGHFENAVEIKSKTFREQLQKVVKVMQYAKDKKIVMYCTGGIRCEKATAWMYFNGFQHIYHIQGGIIGYVNDAKKNNLPIFFKGKNFVFDHRMSEKISDDVISFCHQCNKSSDNYVNCKNNLCHLLFIQCINCFNIFNGCCSYNCIKKI
ncbi:oxygen-dependent tRNA uridine(34) hydroxylase TrhO [Buchnera aphidicola]|uniref:tRNA uridine(34) hydroxylase n=1 Tax=Buchnera aphidicola (Lipaphis pseudobrassicae) TaxID=1258543 RepID=A0A4D6Y0P1_9GAMM|nr:rhodanese-related sulfurtransferase [Buchnera aphidicola]QCI22223.1 rhodanese-related sulfurtransferase [Buchnera aphidicola (Lipaphis pseudobrassicae)]